MTQWLGHRLMMHEVGALGRLTLLAWRTSAGVSTVPERGETSWTGPVERDVLARIRRPLKLEAERVDGTDRRFAPGHELSRPGFGARRVCRAAEAARTHARH